MESFKLKVKIGNAEFDADGPEAGVKEQFAAFMEAVVKAKQVVPSAIQSPPPPPAAEADAQDERTSVDHIDQALDLDGLDPDLVEKVFLRDRQGHISLRHLPKSKDVAADTLILLIYGHRLLKGEANVPAGDLAGGARQSGVTVGRVDHALLDKLDLIVGSGQRRGKRYGLNNRGLAQARQLVQQHDE